VIAYFFERHRDFDITSGLRRIDRANDVIHDKRHHRPLGIAEHNDRDLPAGKVLLISNVLVGGNYSFKDGLFRAPLERDGLTETGQVLLAFHCRKELAFARRL